jgi:hypothetical protein
MRGSIILMPVKGRQRSVWKRRDRERGRTELVADGLRGERGSVKGRKRGRRKGDAPERRCDRKRCETSRRKGKQVSLVKGQVLREMTNRNALRTEPLTPHRAVGDLKSLGTDDVEALVDRGGLGVLDGAMLQAKELSATPEGVGRRWTHLLLNATHDLRLVVLADVLPTLLLNALVVLLHIDRRAGLGLELLDLRITLIIALSISRASAKRWRKKGRNRRTLF